MEIIILIKVKNINNFRAKDNEIKLLAIGRFFLIGCSLSFSISIMSLNTYTADAIKQKLIKVNSVGIRSWIFMIFREKIKGINTMVFLI